MLLDLHTDFSGGRSGGLVFPSLEEFSTVCCNPHSQSFGVVNKVKVMFFWNSSCFFNDPADAGNFISGSSSFSKSSLNTCKFTVYVLLKPSLENFEHYFTSLRDECSCAVVWTFFGTAFLWDWNDTFQLFSCWCIWHWGFPGGSVVKNPPTNTGDSDSILVSRRSPGKDMVTLSSILGLGNSTDRGAWRATVHGVTKVSDMI